MREVEDKSEKLLRKVGESGGVVAGVKGVVGVVVVMVVMVDAWVRKNSARGGVQGVKSE